MVIPRLKSTFRKGSLNQEAPVIEIKSCAYILWVSQDRRDHKTSICSAKAKFLRR